MKKYICIAAAALVAMAGCSKIENAPEAQREINFEVANSVRTKATGSVYNNGAFGTYAWFNNTDVFMTNEQVNLAAGVWKTIDHTFYWPKSGSISFISYSPFAGTSNTAGTVPAITKNSITYTNVTVGGTDLMYADRATCSANVNEVTDSDTADSGYKGVPTVFHHALAKLSFKVLANFTEWDDATNGSHTEWEVTLNSFKISGFKNNGSCALTLNADGKTWDKPVTDIGTAAAPVNVNVWTVGDATSVTTAQELVTTPVVLTTSAQDLSAATGFVMPQALLSGTGAQTITIEAHIKTTLSNGNVINEDFTKTVDISAISSLKAWEMNQNIVYTIKFKPTAKADGSEGQDDSPEDVTITFDPAVADWTTVDASAVIQL